MKWAALLCTILAIGIWIYYMLDLKAFKAEYWGINVFIMGLFISIAVVIIAFAIFGDVILKPNEPVATWFLAVVFVGFVLATMVGTQLTEPKYNDNSGDSGYNYNNSRVGNYYYFFNSGSSSSISSSKSGSSSSSSSSSKDEAAILLIVVLVVVVIAALVVPHFWIIAGMICITFLILITIREFQEMRTSRFRYNRYHY